MVEGRTVSTYTTYFVIRAPVERSVYGALGVPLEKHMHGWAL